MKLVSYISERIEREEEEEEKTASLQDLAWWHRNSRHKNRSGRFPLPLPPPALVRLSSRRIPRRRGGGNPFLLVERGRRVRCSSRGTEGGGKVLPPSPSPVSLVSRADLFRRARFQFSRTPMRCRWFTARAPSAFTHASSMRNRR